MLEIIIQRRSNVKEPRMSKSKANCYMSCPMQYKLQYIDKLKVPMAPALRRGIDIHNICEEFFKFPTISEAEEYIKKKYDVSDYLPAINNLSTFLRTISEGEEVIKPLLIEKRFFDKELNFTGILDAAFKDDKGNIIVLDWKTGKTRGVKHHRFELALYYLLLKRQTGIDATHWGIYFIDNEDISKGFQVERVIEEEVTKSLSTLYDIRERINNGEFPKSPKYGCMFCGFYKNGCDGV